MISAAVLVGFGLVLIVAGPRLIGLVVRAEAAPVSGIAAWLGTSAAALLSLGAGMTLLCRYVWASTPGIELLERCLRLLSSARLSEPVPLIAELGLMVFLAGSVRLLWCATRQVWTAGRDRRALRRRLALLVAPHAPEQGVQVIDQAHAAAFCLPGWGRGEVYVTSAALQVLSPAELAAVLAHERAHLRGRHALAVSAATLLRTAFPFAPLFRAAAEALPRLAEMAADDAAARRTDRKTVATALLRLAEAAAPVAALGAGGSAVGARARRLVAPACRPSRLRRGIVWAMTSLSLTSPTAVALLVPAAACPCTMV